LGTTHIESHFLDTTEDTNLDINENIITNNTPRDDAMACSEERLQRRLCRWWVRQDCGAWDNRLERHFYVGRSNWPITEKGQRGVMVGVVVVVIVLFSLVVFQGNIAWLGDWLGFWRCRSFLPLQPHPLVALIYGTGSGARESLALLDAEGRKGFCLFGHV
jgi:hypothetical protein